MGGHGALMMAFRNPQRFRSVSAFAPIVNPCQSRGAARRSPPIWAATKASGCSTTVAICQPAARENAGPIDQGDDDQFPADQLQPARLAELARQRDWPLTLRIQPGYDHSYFTIATFVEDHLRFHAEHLFR